MEDAKKTESDQVGNESTELADESQNVLSSSESTLPSPTEDSPEKVTSQEELNPKTAEKIGGKPWVDFIPPLEHIRPQTAGACIDEQIDTLNEVLRLKEAYKLATLDQKIHNSYYQMWLNDSNDLFRTIVRLRLRKTNDETKADKASKNSS